MLERLSIRNSIRNLRTFPYVQRLEAEGKLAVHGAWFDISTGELWVMDNETGDFHPSGRLTIRAKRASFHERLPRFSRIRAGRDTLPRMRVEFLELHTR